MADALRLDNEKQILKQYYAGQQIESPNGGFLMLLGVRGGDGGAVAIFECSATSMRYEADVPKATRTERKKVKDVVEAGDGQVPRYRQAHLVRDLHDACRHVVVAGEDGGGRVGQFQQTARAANARFERIVTLADKPAVEIESEAAQPVAIAEVAVEHRLVVLVPDDETDPPVAE